MIVNKRKSLAQNFLTKSHFAVTLLNESSINQNDTIYEIGPGKGRLTKEIAKRVKKIIAIEKDHALYVKLLRKFGHTDNITVHNADFLSFKIKESHYKVFANVPFNITSAVVRKLVYTENPPEEAYLIVQREAAEKFIGVPKTTQFSVLLKPRFFLKITRYFRRTDFSPIPSVDVAMLHIKKRNCPLVATKDTMIYESFIKRGFGVWKKNLKTNYKGIFSYQQWKRLSRDFAFPIHAKPSELSFGQWLDLFKFYKTIWRN